MLSSARQMKAIYGDNILILMTSFDVTEYLIFGDNDVLSLIISI
jgi:hypothetical protein